MGKLKLKEFEDDDDEDDDDEDDDDEDDDDRNLQRILGFYSTT